MSRTISGRKKYAASELYINPSVLKKPKRGGKFSYGVDQLQKFL